MTNEQLAILLDGIQQELDSAIAQARALLVDARPRKHERRHMPPTLCFTPDCKNPDHFRETESDDPVSELDAIEEVSASIGNRIRMLRWQKESS